MCSFLCLASACRQTTSESTFLFHGTLVDAKNLARIRTKHPNEWTQNIMPSWPESALVDKRTVVGKYAPLEAHSGARRALCPARPVALNLAILLALRLFAPPSENNKTVWPPINTSWDSMHYWAISDIGLLFTTAYKRCAFYVPKLRCLRFRRLMLQKPTKCGKERRTNDHGMHASTIWG